MQRLRFFPVYSFSSLFIISFFVHVVLAFVFGVLFNFSEILDNTPQTYRFISVDWEPDKIQKNKKVKKLLSNVNREESGYFLKNKKIQIQENNQKNQKNLLKIQKETPTKEIKKKSLDFKISKKEDILGKKREFFQNSSSVIYNKSKISKKISNSLDNSKDEKRKLTSKKKVSQFEKIIIEKKQESNRTKKPISVRNNLKSKYEEDRLKLFRIDSKEKKIFKVTEMLLDKVVTADFQSKKKNKDDEPISLSTSKTEYFRYFKHIKEKIEESWVWWAPEARGLSGELKLQFTLQKDGRLKKIHLLKSSGHGVLDDEAISAVTRASFSFRPFPLRLKRKTLKIQGTFEYLSERFFVRKFLKN